MHFSTKIDWHSLTSVYDVFIYRETTRDLNQNLRILLDINRKIADLVALNRITSPFSVAHYEQEVRKSHHIGTIFKSHDQ